MKVTATLYNFDGTEKWTQDAMVDVFPETASVAFTVPQLPDLSTTYFLKLYATDRFSKVASDNFYWLSTKPDELAWDKTHDTVNTPQSAYADMTALQRSRYPFRCGCRPNLLLHHALRPSRCVLLRAPTTPPVNAAECDGGFLVPATDREQSHQDAGLHDPATAG